MASVDLSAERNVAAHPQIFPELSVVIPVLNESKNIILLVERLERALKNINWECIIVDDDSSDGTAHVARTIARTRSNVRVIHRVGRQGLASACMEGIMASHAEYAAILDGDMQHDETLLTPMLEAIRAPNIDLVIGSRHMDAGSFDTMSPLRKAISQTAAWMSRFVLKCELSDPMSGFFMIRTDCFRSVSRRLTCTGFKILLDIVLSAPEPLRYIELPYHFRQRVHGQSKLGAGVIFQYIELLLDKKLGDFVPVRFLKFLLVGLAGVFTHLVITGALYRGLHLSFALSQVSATIGAMIGNFTLNNIVTFRDRQLRGRRFLYGLGTFCLACSVGAIFNIKAAELLLKHGRPWMVAAIVGLVISALWNYAVTSMFTWRRHRLEIKRPHMTAYNAHLG